MARTQQAAQANITLQEQIEAIHKAKGLVPEDDSKEKIGPSKPNEMPQPPPLSSAPNMPSNAPPIASVPRPPSVSGGAYIWGLPSPRQMFPDAPRNSRLFFSDATSHPHDGSQCRPRDAAPPYDFGSPFATRLRHCRSYASHHPCSPDQCGSHATLGSPDYGSASPSHDRANRSVFELYLLTPGNFFS